MKRITGYLRWLVPTAVIVGLVPLGGAIASANDAPAQGGSATLNASGATFPQPYYESVIGAFKQKNSNVTINYAGGGSGKGRQDFADQVVDFAGSDAPYSAADAANVKGGTFFYFPTVAAAITVAHRADSSGTTQNFTGFLAAAAPTAWTLGTGSTVSWPSDQQAGQGNAGVGQVVKTTDGAIGYVDFSDAKALKLKFASG